MTNKANKKIFTILLDTNAVTALSLFIEACDIVGKKPNKINEKNELKQLLDEKNVKTEWLCFEEKGGINQGLKVFSHLKKKANKHEIRIYFPRMTEIEALHLIMERKFHEELTKRGIQYRLRTKKVMRLQVDFDCKEIYKNWDDFKNNLYKQDIRLLLPELEFRGLIDDAVSISNILIKYILLQPVDLFLYAIGIRIGADEIYTRDDEFKKIINNIAKGAKGDAPEWQEIADSLTEELINTFLAIKEEFIKEQKIKLPKGVPS